MVSVQRIYQAAGGNWYAVGVVRDLRTELKYANQPDEATVIAHLEAMDAVAAAEAAEAEWLRSLEGEV